MAKRSARKAGSSPPQKWRGKNGKMLAFFVNMTESERNALDWLAQTYEVAKATVLRSLIVEAERNAKKKSKEVRAQITLALRETFERKPGRRAA